MGRADSTMEIDASDILEARALQRGSISPVVFESDIGAPKAAPDPRRQLLRSIVMGTMAGCLILLVIAAIRPHSDAPKPQAGPAKPLPLPVVSPVMAPSTAWQPVAADPTPTSGTITSASVAGSVMIDGLRLRSAQTTVTCGQHSLRIGRGASRDVVVPCGGILAIQRDGRITVR